MKIALVGSAPASSRIAPYNDPSWEIWGCSPGLFGVAPRVTQWFELHLWEPGQPWFSPEYCQWLGALPDRGLKLWTGAEIKELPGSLVLPAQELLDEFDPSRWFCTSSLFWMMAMAIKAGATKIGLWGVDMAAAEEYEMQRAGIQYLAYVARARGIEVGVPPESDLFTPRFRYGIDEWTHSFRKVRARNAELAARLQAADRARIEAEQATFFLKGAIDDLKYMGDTWVDKSTWTAPVDLPKAAIPLSTGDVIPMSAAGAFALPRPGVLGGVTYVGEPMAAATATHELGGVRHMP